MDRGCEPPVPIEAFSPNYRFQLDFDYAITQAVTLPGGLHGALSKRFLVLAGVPAPQGDPGHSCVAMMDGFRTNRLTSCLVGPHEAIEDLQKLPTPDSLQACRLIELAKNVRLEAVSAYQPEGSVSGFRTKPTPVPIAVRVVRRGDIVLVLNVYDPAIWRVSTSTDTRIAAVLLIGYYTSTVEGVRQDTPVVAADYEGGPQRPMSDPICEPFHSYLSSAHDGGPHALLLDRQAQALTGRSLDRLSGDYALKEVELEVRPLAETTINGKGKYRVTRLDEPSPDRS